MPLYMSSSVDGTKQVPVNPTINGTQVSRATCPAGNTVVKRPSYVNINTVGTYAFLYETTASYGGTTTAGFVTGSIVVANHGNVKLDINPLAWTRCDAANAVGQITFVYKRTR